MIKSDDYYDRKCKSKVFNVNYNLYINLDSGSVVPELFTQRQFIFKRKFGQQRESTAVADFFMLS